MHAANAKAVWNALANDRYRSAAGLQSQKSNKTCRPRLQQLTLAQPWHSPLHANDIESRHTRRFGLLQDVPAGVRVTATHEVPRALCQPVLSLNPDAAAA